MKSPRLFELMFLGLLAWYSCASTFGRTLYVVKDNTNASAPYTNWYTAATNIQAAIDVATNGDTVLVTNGVYDTGGVVVGGSLTTNRIAITNVITVQSVNGAVSTEPRIWVRGTINNSQASVTVNGVRAFVSSGEYDAEAVLEAEGDNVITVDAVDIAGNASSVSVNVIQPSDKSALINIDAPFDGCKTRSRIVCGSAPPDTINVTVNGVSAELTGDLRFIARPFLTEGVNTVTIVATDKFRNSFQKTLTFEYRTVAPKLAIVSPMDGSTVNKSPTSVTGTADPSIKIVVVNPEMALLNGGGFNADRTRLFAGWTLIAAVGSDESNNQYCDYAIVESPALSEYEIEPVSGSAAADDPTRPVAGASRALRARLLIDGAAAEGREVKFSVKNGNGSMRSSSATTDASGVAEAELITDNDARAQNTVECCPAENPLEEPDFGCLPKWARRRS